LKAKKVSKDELQPSVDGLLALKERWANSKTFYNTSKGGRQLRRIDINLSFQFSPQQV
jgi:hypothetical protein